MGNNLDPTRLTTLHQYSFYSIRVWSCPLISGSVGKIADIHGIHRNPSFWADGRIQGDSRHSINTTATEYMYGIGLLILHSANRSADIHRTYRNPSCLTEGRMAETTMHPRTVDCSVGAVLLVFGTDFTAFNMELHRLYRASLPSAWPG